MGKLDNRGRRALAKVAELFLFGLVAQGGQLKSLPHQSISNSLF